MTDIRWKQRFQNFERAFILLRSALETKPLEEFSDLEQEGIIQRFEYTFELAWKTVKDYLLFNGVNLEKITPRDTIKQAFAANIIKDGQAWLDMLEDRNLMSHTYENTIFKKVIKTIKDVHLNTLEQTYLMLKEKSVEEWTLD